MRKVLTGLAAGLIAPAGAWAREGPPEPEGPPPAVGSAGRPARSRAGSLRRMTTFAKATRKRLRTSESEH
jgi:hypothetical protein